MAIKGIDKRGMVRDRQQAIVGLSNRVTLLTSTSPEPDMDNTDPYAARATSAPEQYIIRAFFSELKSERDTSDPEGNVRLRRGYIEYHQIYADRVRDAQSCIIHQNGIDGRWLFTGTIEITGGTTQKAYLTSQD